MENNQSKKIIIMGGGPAGLTAGLELVKNNQSTLIVEADKQVGGISRTVNYKGYYFDIGGHRFFTKEPEVKKLWEEILPDDFLKRPRLSRIYYNNKFFYYPLKPFNALLNVGPIKSIEIFFSYVITRLKYYLGGRKTATNFEDWVVQRFGRKLFNIFFKTYTEKVWGTPTNQIGADWAAQRIKGLSLLKAIKEAIFPSKQKLTTLIDEFSYPKYGVGMMYDKMADIYLKKNGELLLETKAVSLKHFNNKISGAILQTKTGQQEEKSADYFISTIPLPELVKILQPAAPSDVIQAANNLNFRAFFTVCLILDQKESFADNWIYIHSPEVKVGRIQNFKQWSPYMVPDPSKTTLGMEYFCFVGDELWQMSDQNIFELAKKELEKIGLGRADKVIDGLVVKLKDVYPVYDQNYKQNLDKIYGYLKQFKNLQIAGRGGIFRYNNMDHSILTGLYSARNILGGNYDVLKINLDEEYHEVAKNN
jgi:protoporphyrinogen oxidase